MFANVIVCFRSTLDENTGMKMLDDVIDSAFKIFIFILA